METTTPPGEGRRGVAAGAPRQVVSGESLSVARHRPPGKVQVAFFMPLGPGRSERGGRYLLRSQLLRPGLRCTGLRENGAAGGGPPGGGGGAAAGGGRARGARFAGRGGAV